jgi:hypothetical protein
MLKSRFAAFLLCLTVFCLPAHSTSPSIKYTVSYSPQKSTSAWEISAVVYGAPRSTSPLVAELDTWGNWENLGEDYFSGFTADPPAKIVKKSLFSWEITLPKGGEDSLQVRYTLKLGPWPEKRKAFSQILPFCSDEYCSGFAENTLCSFSQDGKPLESDRTLQFDLPSGWKATTGWGEPGLTGAAVALDKKNENGVITFGKNTRASFAEADGVRYQVFQNGLDRDITRETLALTQKIYGFYARLLGVIPHKQLRLFIPGTHGVGTNTEHGIRLSVDDPDSIRTVDHKRWLAHELFHDWLGGLLTESTGEDMIWFMEGFTEYMAYRTMVDAGLADTDWFSQRLMKFDRSVRGNSANAAAVLGSPAKRIHDSDLEGLAYAKGCLTAFQIDARLRADRKGSVAEMLRDLLRRPGKDYSQESVQGWLREHGLGDFVADYILKPGTPSLEEALRLVGYELTTSSAPLAYLGIDCDDNTPQRIRAIDPAGPAAMAGLRTGDFIYGYIRTRNDNIQVSTAVTTPYRFGMTYFHPERPAFIDIKRGQEQMRIKVLPKAVEGGLLPEFHLPDSAAGKARFFFEQGAAALYPGAH